MQRSRQFSPMYFRSQRSQALKLSVKWPWESSLRYSILFLSAQSSMISGFQLIKFCLPGMPFKSILSFYIIQMYITFCSFKGGKCWDSTSLHGLVRKLRLGVRIFPTLNSEISKVEMPTSNQRKLIKMHKWIQTLIRTSCTNHLDKVQIQESSANPKWQQREPKIIKIKFKELECR